MQDVTTLQRLFRKNVKRRLKELGQNQRWLASRLEITEQSVSTMLSGRHTTTLAMIERVAEALGVTGQFLFTEIEREEVEAVS